MAEPLADALERCAERAGVGSSLRVGELRNVLRRLGVEMSQEDLDRLLAMGDCPPGASGTVEWRSFVRVLSDERAGGAAGGAGPPAAAGAGPAPKPEPADPDVGAGADRRFEARAKGMIREWRQEFEEELRAERDALRQGYDKAVQRAQASAMERCSEIIAAMQAQGGGVGSVEGLDLVGKVCKLKDTMSSLKASCRSLSDGHLEYPFQSITAQALQAIIDDTQSIQQYARQCLESLTLTLEPQAMDGSLYPVQVRPAVDTVAATIAKIRRDHSTKHSNLKLILRGGLVVMRHQDVLLDYDLSSGINVVVLSDPVAEQRVRVTFATPEDLGYEMMSDSSGEFLHPGDLEAVSVDNRSGILMKARCVLKLPTPVKLEGEWTVSVWTLAPAPSRGRRYRVLMDGGDPESMILLTLQGNQIGFYTRGNSRFVREAASSDSSSDSDPSETSDPGEPPGNEQADPPGQQGGRRRRHQPFSFARLTDGWHHLAAVGAQGQVSYYVDGQLIGSLPAPRKLMSGEICYVGNTAQGVNEEAFGVMSDLRIFGVAASPEQVQDLFSCA